MPRILLIGLIILGIIILAVILSLVGLLPGKKTAAPPAASISLWGSQDTEDVWRKTLEDFHTQYPLIRVTYKKIAPDAFEEKLVNAIAEGAGPDMALLPQSLILKHHDKLLPLPQQAFGFDARAFKNLFADAFSDDLIDKNGDIIGMPLFIDTPILLYNKDMFNAADIAQPPQTWDETVSRSRSLTTRSPAGDILISGLAIGAGTNVERSFEIVNSMIMQNAPRMAPDINRRILFDAGAFMFYTSFSTPSSQNFSWTGRMDGAFALFGQEQAAMAIGMSEDIPRVLAKNPHLNLGIAGFPQQAGSRFPVVYGDYFFPAVLKTSKNPGAAWQFVFYASAGDGAKTYAQSSGRPAARRDLLSGQAPSPALDIPYRQALIARTWKLPDNTAARRLFTQTLDAIVSGQSTQHEAIDKLTRQIQLLYP